jgi:hypothetical protein
MKKLITFTVSLLITSIIANAQVPKTSIVEHFTNTSCGVCAGANPGIVSTLNSHPTVLSIRFHPSAPYASDFFNQQNQAENDARTNHYGIYGGTPRVVVNGSLVSTNNLNSTLTALQTETSNFSIKAFQEKINADSFAVTIIIKKEAADTNQTAKLFVGMIEDLVNQSTNNGETAHYNVFRKAMSSATGNTITLPIMVGDSIVEKFGVMAGASWAIAKLNSIAILQSNAKKVINAVKSIPAVTIPNAISNYTLPNNFVSFDKQSNILKFQQAVTKFKVFDATYKMVFQQMQLSLQSSFELPRLTPGVYFIAVEGPVKHKTQQILIQP